MANNRKTTATLAVKLGKIESNIPLPENTCTTSRTSKYEEVLKLKVKESIDLGCKYSKDNEKTAKISITSLLRVRSKTGGACKTHNWKMAYGEYQGNLRVWRIK